MDTKDAVRRNNFLNVFMTLRSFRRDGMFCAGARLRNLKSQIIQIVDITPAQLASNVPAPNQRAACLAPGIDPKHDGRHQDARISVRRMNPFQWISFPLSKVGYLQVTNPNGKKRASRTRCTEYFKQAKRSISVLSIRRKPNMVCKKSRINASSSRDECGAGRWLQLHGRTKV